MLADRHKHAARDSSHPVLAADPGCASRLPPRLRPQNAYPCVGETLAGCWKASSSANKEHAPAHRSPPDKTLARAKRSLKAVGSHYSMMGLRKVVRHIHVDSTRALRSCLARHLPRSKLNIRRAALARASNGDIAMHWRRHCVLHVICARNLLEVAALSLCIVGDEVLFFTVAQQFIARVLHR